MIWPMMKDAEKGMPYQLRTAVSNQAAWVQYHFVIGHPSALKSRIASQVRNLMYPCSLSSTTSHQNPSSPNYFSACRVDFRVVFREIQKDILFLRNLTILFWYKSEIFVKFLWWIDCWKQIKWVKASVDSQNCDISAHFWEKTKKNFGPFSTSLPL
jgi:hypothetical protein